MKFLEGKKTYIGIATTLLGLFFGEADVNLIVDGLDKAMVLAGSLLAAWGRFKAKPDTGSGEGTKPKRP